MGNQVLSIQTYIITISKAADILFELVQEHIHKRLEPPRALQKGARHALLTLGYEVITSFADKETIKTSLFYESQVKGQETQTCTSSIADARHQENKHGAKSFYNMNIITLD